VTLSRAQLAAAQRLLQRGLTLREIADRIDATFEAVCLGLFGGSQSTGASQERAQTATGLGAGGDNLAPRSRPTATAKTGVPTYQSQASGGGQSQDNSGVRVVPVDTAAALPMPPGQRFRLVSEHGESLHENERVLTRLSKFFWRGDAAAVAELKARRPQWSRLAAVAVLSGAEATHAAH